MSSRLAIFCCILLTACVGNDPQFPTTPEIAFVSIAPSVIQENVDPFTVTITYKDGDGDLGYEDEFSGIRDSADLILIDTRPDVALLPDYDGRWEYNLPSLTPEASNPSIQGEITLEFPAVPLILNPLNAEEKLRFEIYLIDRAGNRSNTITTDEITIVK